MECLLHMARAIKVASEGLASDHRVTNKRTEVVSDSHRILGWGRGRMVGAAGSLGGAGREVTCGSEGGEGEVTWGLEEVVGAAV